MVIYKTGNIALFHEVKVNKSTHFNSRFKLMLKHTNDRVAALVILVERHNALSSMNPARYLNYSLRYCCRPAGKIKFFV